MRRVLVDHARAEPGLNWALTVELGGLIDLEEGKIKEAKAGFISATEVAESSFQSEHPWWVAQFRVGRARCLIAQGRHEEAEAILLTSHQELEERLGRMHHRTQNCIRILAELYQETGRPEEAAKWRALERPRVIPKAAAQAT